MVECARGLDMELVSIASDLRAAVRELEFAAPVSHVYRPLDYAWKAHRSYLDRFGSSPKQVVLLGMNPGPWGMSQTGVPFGEVAAVRDWLEIRDPVGRPEVEHPKRPVEGLGCSRSEVSGRRVWSWAKDVFGTPERFFERFFVANYCPLLFLESSGRNRTPDRLPASERRSLELVCDRALERTVEALRPQRVIGFGNFAERCAQRVLSGSDVTIGRVLHPSPASPAANRGWASQVTAQLREMGVVVP